MDMYVRLYEDKYKAKDDNATIGLILCAKKDETIIQHQKSIESRAKMTALNYLGLVKLLELRDWSKKKTRIAKTTNKSLHYLHDIGFALTVGVPIQTGVYLSSGVDDWKKIAASIGASFLVTSALAGPGLQVIDTFREITRKRFNLYLY